MTNKGWECERSWLVYFVVVTGFGLGVGGIGYGAVRLAQRRPVVGTCTPQSSCDYRCLGTGKRNSNEAYIDLKNVEYFIKSENAHGSCTWFRAVVVDNTDACHSDFRRYCEAGPSKCIVDFVEHSCRAESLGIISDPAVKWGVYALIVGLIFVVGFGGLAFTLYLQKNGFVFFLDKPKYRWQQSAAGMHPVAHATQYGRGNESSGMLRSCDVCDGSGKRGLFGPVGFGFVSKDCDTCNGRGSL